MKPTPILLLFATVFLFLLAPLAEAGLDDEMGRNEVRVWSAPYRPPIGATVAGMALPARLEALGYERVHRKPETAGEYFWGHEVFWIYRRPHRVAGRPWPAERFALALDPETGRVTGYLEADGDRWRKSRRSFRRTPWLEPELLAESLEPDRTPRVPVDFEALPERVWRPLLAAEDHRFFDHVGLDAIGIARALLKNALAGEVTQGGSTLTQQLVKMRDLTPRRTLGRKVSEAVRALALEAEFDKREILDAYLDHVYLGHHEGVGIYGYGAGARYWFGKRTEELDLAEAAVLAALVQGPNRLHPVRHPERLGARVRWVLDRLGELGWASREELARARQQGLSTLAAQPPPPPAVVHLLSWLRQLAEREADELLDVGRGLWVETTIDPHLQAVARQSVAAGLAALRRRVPRLGDRPLAGALVALDAETGDVLAYVGGDPEARGDRFDRARQAERQPGSTVKPLVLLEAFDRCGGREPLYPARRVADEPLVLDLPSGPWRPENFDDRFRGPVTVRRALVESLNVPLVRIARWCGFEATAERVEAAGLDLPDSPPPSFVLGAVETSPLALAAAYTPFVDRGRVLAPRPVTRLERPSGARLAWWPVERVKVADPAAAFLVRDLLADAAHEAGAAPLAEHHPFGKTGTSSEARDAWMAGGAGSVVAVTWVGLDDGGVLGLSGAGAAAPIWRAFLEAAAPARPVAEPERPRAVVEAWVEEETGLRVREGRAGAVPELFRRGDLPPRRRALQRDEPLPVLE